MAAICCYNANAMDRNWYIPSDVEVRVCGGNCDPAFALEADGTWHCACGCWEPVAAAPTMLFPDLAAYDGQRLWGDIWLDEQDAEFARLSEHEQRMRTLLAASKAREASEALARAAALSEMAKARSLVCDRSGKIKVAKQKMLPCRYFKFRGVLGAPEPAGTNKKGVSWLSGCELHHCGKCRAAGKAPGSCGVCGCCEFIHPDQAEWKQFTEAAKPLAVGAAIDFGALARGSQKRW
jgi:hypothetical protein